MKILKFGGTSVGSPESLERVAAIVSAAAAEGPVLVVASALGGVTDELVRAIDLAVHRDGEARAIISGLRERHERVLDAISGGAPRNGAGIAVEHCIARLGELLKGVALIGACPASVRHEILSHGERMSLRIVAEALRKRNVDAAAIDAAELIVATPDDDGATVDFAETRRRVCRQARLLTTGVPVVSGFIAADPDGGVATLGRGGSDFTATILAEALEADLVEIWTDVDGAMSADPRVVREAFTLRRLSYTEASEMAWRGARVLHPRTLEPLVRRRIPVAIRNTHRPGARATRIDGATRRAGVARAVTAIDDVSIFRVFAAHANDDEIAGRIPGTLNRNGIAPLFLTHNASDGSVTLGVAGSQAARAERAIRREMAASLQRTDSAALVSVVGEGIAARPDVASRLFRELDRQRIDVREIVGGSSGASLSVAIDSSRCTAAVRILHDTLVLQRRSVNVVLAGATGRVGAALRRQIDQQRAAVRRELGVDLRLSGLVSSRFMRWNGEGTAARDELGEPRLPWPALEERIAGEADRVEVFVDCTASAEVAGLYGRFLGRGIGVVTANKIAGAGPLAEVRDLRRLSRRRRAPFLYETTVGAALPILESLATLRRGGDRILGFDAVLSGTLSFVLSRVGEGVAFSNAVREAIERGLTEPDPSIDLGGEDVARKLVILARECGYDLERQDVDLEPLMPSGISFNGDVDAFTRSLAPMDVRLAERAARDGAEGRRLVVLAQFDGNRACVGLQSVPASSALAAARGCENVLVARTERYGDAPLTIAGPGAGPEVTAAGVLADVIRAVKTSDW